MNKTFLLKEFNTLIKNPLFFARCFDSSFTCFVKLKDKFNNKNYNYKIFFRVEYGNEKKYTCRISKKYTKILCFYCEQKSADQLVKEMLDFLNKDAE